MELDRRLGERILQALEMALDQQELEIAEHLATALELSLTRFGGPGAIDKRLMPPGLEPAFQRLKALRKAAPTA